ncbi:nuclear transport factor 2 family protein, partial [Streptomyces anthocyanicus]
AVSAREARAVVDSFRRALETRDPQDFLALLAPDVVLVSDGGGIKRAALRPVVGADKVTRFYLGGTHKHDVTVTTEPTVVNGAPALAVRVDGELDGVMALRVEDGLISGLYYVRNPEKLSHALAATSLTLH